MRLNSDPWFRFYVRTLNNPKVQRLPGSTFKGWVNLLCLAKETDGTLPPIEDISFRLRLSGPKTESLLNTLRASGLVEGNRMHDWGEMQYTSDSSTERVKQHRKRLKDCSNVSSNVSETVQRRTETEEEKETEEGREVKQNIPPVNGSLPPSLSDIEKKDKSMTLELFNSLPFETRQDFEVYYKEYHHIQEPRWQAMKDFFKRNLKDNRERVL